MQVVLGALEGVGGEPERRARALRRRRVDLGSLRTLRLRTGLLNGGVGRRLRLSRYGALTVGLGLGGAHLLGVARGRRGELGFGALGAQLRRVARLGHVVQRKLAQLQLTTQLFARTCRRRKLLGVARGGALELRREAARLLARGRLCLLSLEHPLLPLRRRALALDDSLRRQHLCGLGGRGRVPGGRVRRHREARLGVVLMSTGGAR